MSCHLELPLDFLNILSMLAESEALIVHVEQAD